MGYQTHEALVKRKLLPWLKNRVITVDQFKDILFYSFMNGFWDGLGYATKVKYKNLRKGLSSDSSPEQESKRLKFIAVMERKFKHGNYYF